MKKYPIREKLPLVLFFFGLVFFSFGYGIVAGLFGLPPAPALRNFYNQIADSAQYWKNDTGIEPTRHLVDAWPGRPKGLTIYRPEGMGDGYVMIAGLTPHRDALNSAVLYDHTGKEVHVWPLHYDNFAKEPRPQNVFLHGMAFYPDGSAIVNFDSGQALARVDACGGTMWVDKGEYHHAVSPGDDGTVWSMDNDRLTELDAATGKVLRRISIINDLFPRYPGLLGMRTEENDKDELQFDADAFHDNHVEPLTKAMAAAFPMFKPGDILVSLRNLNLVFVMDPETLTIEWSNFGPWNHQHSPHFEPDGSIIVYNNNMNFKKSSIIAIDPATHVTKTLFEGSEKAPFYSWRRGTVEELPDGRLLIAETEKGRVFMVNARGELIFEYNNTFDDKYNGVVSTARYIPAGFFAKGALDCPKGRQIG
jgi:hypothetical protein